jgi:phosphatidylglycerol---prolipoprotein diacylglyceryl transferase
VPIGVITFNFDPLLYIGDTTQIRIQTVVLGLIFAASLLLAILNARLTSRRLLRTEGHGIAVLRIDDFGFIIVGVVPGAVVGGRLGYVLLHLDYYAKHVGAIVDPSQGNLELGLAVVGGALTGAYVARLLDAPVGRWADALIVPVLFALGAGKLALILGGEGQGLPSSASWATAYGGDGPWGSLAPTIPSHPSQAYEGVVTLVLLVIVGALQLAGLFRRRTGSALLVGIALWAIGRAVVAATWRDVAILGPLRVDQLMSFLIVAACLVLLTIDIQPAAEEEEGQAPEPWEAWDLDVERRLLGGHQALQLPANVSAEGVDRAPEASVALAASTNPDAEPGDQPQPEPELVADADTDGKPPLEPAVGPQAELLQEPAEEREPEPVALETEPLAGPGNAAALESVGEADADSEPPVELPSSRRSSQKRAAGRRGADRRAADGQGADRQGPAGRAADGAAPEPAPEPTAEPAAEPGPERVSAQPAEPPSDPTPTFWLASDEDAGGGSSATGEGPGAVAPADNNERG